MSKLVHRLHAFLDMPKKRIFLISEGFYHTLAGGWCDCHCMGIISEREYRAWTLDELMENYPYFSQAL